MPKTKEKSKQLAPHRTGTLLFIGLWILPQVAGWVAAGGLWQVFRDVFTSSDFLNAMLVALVPGLIAAVGQRWLIQRDTGQAMRGWLRASALGWFLAGVIFYRVLRVENTPDDSLPLMFTVLFLPAALVQTVWLHRRVHNAWLWVMATVASAFVFTLPAQATSSNTATMLFGLALAGLLQGSILGMTMRQLWSNPRTKAKRDALLTADMETPGHLALADADAQPDDLLDLSPVHQAAAVQRQVKH